MSKSKGNVGSVLHAAPEKIELAWIGRSRFLRGRKRKLKAETIRKALTGFRREAFEMVVHERPDAPGLGQMPLDLERPAF